jgi:phytoene desaturase
LPVNSDIEPGFEQKMNRYLDKSGRLFHDTVDLVIKNNFDSFFSYITTLMRVNPVHIPVLFRSFWQEVPGISHQKKHARSYHWLHSFLAGHPFDTMAIYTLLSYTEFQHDGYYNVEGGMYKIIEGMVAELEKENVRITYNTEIVELGGTESNWISWLIARGKKWHPIFF